MAKIVKEIYKVHYTVEYYHADDRTTESNDFNIIPIIGKSFLDARNEALNHYDEKLSLVDSMFRFYAGESISEDFDLSTIPNDVLSLYLVVQINLKNDPDSSNQGDTSSKILLKRKSIYMEKDEGYLMNLQNILDRSQIIESFFLNALR